MNIVFFGSSHYVLPILDLLHKYFGIALVVTTERPVAELKKRGAVKTPVIDWCNEKKVHYYGVTDFRTKKAISQHQNPVGILASFGALVSQDVLALFPKGIINIHPSLLPLYRGPTPVQTAIVNGDTQTGVSIMKLDSEIDHGPLLAQEKEAIHDDDTTESLQTRLFAKGAQLLVEILPEYVSGKLEPKPQDHTKATYTEHLTRQSGFIDLAEENRHSGGQRPIESQSKRDPIASLQDDKFKIARMIRAYYPWPGVWTQLQITNYKLRIKFLPNNMVQPEGKKPMSYKDFFNGYPQAKGLLQNIVE